MEPFVQDLAPGCFVRIGIGMDRTTGDLKYRLASVSAVAEGRHNNYELKEYEYVPRSGKTTNRWLILKFGSSERAFKITDVSNGEVTAEMLFSRDSEEQKNREDKEGDGLITQAYAALLVAFLVEGQPALRADVKCTLPEDGFAKLAGVLERFRAFHESLDSISDESRESLARVIRWLRGT